LPGRDNTRQFDQRNDDPSTSEGFEFHLPAIGLALIVIFHGAGKGSLDALIAGRLKKSSNHPSPSGARASIASTGPNTLFGRSKT
jgi:hypothetical protein